MKTMLRITALATLATLAACGPKAEQTTDAMGNGFDNGVSTAGDVVANTFDAAKEAVTPTPTSQEFIDRAAQSDAFEIAAAKLAKTKAVSADVKEFADKMIAAHTESTAKLKTTAAALDTPLTPVATLPQSLQDKLDGLKDKTGKDFDQAYIDGQVDAHQDALSLMKSYADHGDATKLKTLAGDMEPIIQSHLDMAKKLNDSQ